jgi:serine protease Do
VILADLPGYFRGAAFAAVASLGLMVAEPAWARQPTESFSELVDKLMPTVVNITTTQNVPQQGPRLRDMPQLPPGSPFEELFKDFFDKRGGEEQQKRRGTSLGSGFVIDGEGYIVTNNHVIQGAEDITVIFRDDTQLKAKLIGSDSRIDLALLKVEPPNKKPLPAVKWGDSDKSRVGDWVIAIGNPFGMGHSVTAGIISARGRSLNDSLDDYLQTDAAINKGNSGGPLFNTDGEVIGVNTAIYSPSGTNAGLAFSIPSNLVKQVADQLREFGKVKRGWIGVSYQSVTDDIADSFGLDRARGVLVANVTADGPASKAGLKRNDIILSFAGQDVLDLRRFPKIVANTRVGNTVDVVVWRGGKEVPLKLRVGEQEEAREAEHLGAGTEEAGRARPAGDLDHRAARPHLAEGDRPAARTLWPLRPGEGRDRHQGGAQQPGGREAAAGRRRHPRGRPEAGDDAAGSDRPRDQAAAAEEALRAPLRRTPGRPAVCGAQAAEVASDNQRKGRASRGLFCFSVVLSEAKNLA